MTFHLFSTNPCTNRLRSNVIDFARQIISRWKRKNGYVRNVIGFASTVHHFTLDVIAFVIFYDVIDFAFGIPCLYGDVVVSKNEFSKYFQKYKYFEHMVPTNRWALLRRIERYQKRKIDQNRRNRFCLCTAEWRHDGQKVVRTRTRGGGSVQTGGNVPKHF